MKLAFFTSLLSSSGTLALRRTESEQMTGAMSQLQMALSNVKSVQKDQIQAMLSSLQKTAGSSLVLDTIISSLEEAVKKVNEHSGNAETALSDKAIAFGNAVTSSESRLSEAKHNFSSWSSCISSLSGLSAQVNNAFDLRHIAEGNMSSAKTNASNLAVTEVSVTIPEYDCTASDLTRNCTRELEDWLKNGNGKVNTADGEASRGLENYRKANRTWGETIKTFNTAHNTLMQKQNEWLQKKQSCNSIEADLDTSACAWRSAWSARCAAQSNFESTKDSIFGDDDTGTGTVLSQKDREIEYESLTLALCVLNWLDDHDFESGSDFVASECGDVAKLHVGDTLTNTPLEIPDDQSTKYNSDNRNISPGFESCSSEQWVLGAQDYTEPTGFSSVSVSAVAGEAGIFTTSDITLTAEGLWTAYPLEEQYIASKTSTDTWTSAEVATRFSCSAL